MSVPRLPFLYPRFIQHIIASETRALRATLPASQRRTFHASCPRRCPTQKERYGTANEPLPSSDSDKRDPEPTRQHRKAEIVNEEEEEAEKERQRRIFNIADDDVQATGQSSEQKQKLDAGEGHPEEQVSSTALQLSQRPLEKVLHMEPPTSSRQGDDRPPHMQAHPYVHHFDTYTLVDDLKKGGYSHQQSITVMKAVRGLLAANMQLARDGLVSKSDVENGSYLFKAACSELRTEVQNGRQSSADKMRSERAHLQHEVDILSQKVTQETLTLKDELKGMFDDRKMAVRQEQRKMENMIQELNYKIQTQLTGESKGEVEALRWFLTRRAAIFIGSFALILLASIRYSLHMTHVQEQERRKLRDADDTRQSQQSSGPHTIPSRSIATQTGDSTNTVLSNMGTESGQNYVSLG